MIPPDTSSASSQVDRAVGRARAVCEGRGLKLTRLREQILRLVLQHGKPLGAYALMDLLADNSEREHVAPPTVYRTLDFLLSVRLIHKIHSHNAYVANHNPRPNESSVILICEGCGVAQELPNTTIQQAINLSASQHRFHIHQQVVEILGMCVDCRRGTSA